MVCHRPGDQGAKNVQRDLLGRRSWLHCAPSLNNPFPRVVYHMQLMRRLLQLWPSFVAYPPKVLFAAVWRKREPDPFGFCYILLPRDLCLFLVWRLHVSLRPNARFLLYVYTYISSLPTAAPLGFGVVCFQRVPGASTAVVGVEHIKIYLIKDLVACKCDWTHSIIRGGKKYRRRLQLN